jgi:indolepyruvate ferredoxin oxidoreductase alpha subunit
LENIAKYDEIYSEWAPNEKVAVEVAQGACFAGARAIVAMKHVGVNVAADPLFSLAYTGVNGGFIVISADDPGMHSSQNEQDNRYYAKFMKIGLLEPSDSQECKDFVAAGLELSERFDMPFMLRTTTRISHSKGMVALGERCEGPNKRYEKNTAKYVIVPAVARKLRLSLEERLSRLTEYADTFPGNRVEGSGSEFAVITNGIGYQYAREALGDRATYLKLSLTYPLPCKLIKDFVDKYETVYVIEEGEPFLEEQIKNMGLKVIGKELFPHVGELSAAIVRQKLLQENAANTADLADAPARPPVLCPGCPHRGVFYAINKVADIVTSDIGCYSLGIMPPLNGGETCICMGASIGNAMGMAKMMPDKKIVATIGDSTFIHSGITGLVDVVYNRGALTVVILDNAITGMTGHQHHPGTGYTVKNQPTTKVDLVELVKGCGVRKVWTVNAYDLTEVEDALQQAVNCGEAAVVIAKQPCVLITDRQHRQGFSVNEACKYCRMCFNIGCPAIEARDGKAAINAELCNGCGICAQICKFSAIVKAGATNG